ncbi:MAG: hypothetical protein ACFBZ8_07970 [Opitutales bacterium]
MKRRKPLLCALALSIWISACSSDQKSQLWISYLPPRDIATALPAPAARSIAIGDFEDERRRTREDVLVERVQDRNRSAQREYRLVTPFPLLVQDHIRTSLEGARYRVTAFSEADFVITGSIIDFEVTELAGPIYSDLTANIVIELRLTDRRSGQLVWSERVGGSGSIRNSTDIKSVYTATLDAFTRQFVSEPGLQAAVLAN